MFNLFAKIYYNSLTITIPLLQFHLLLLINVQNYYHIQYYIMHIELILIERLQNRIKYTYDQLWYVSMSLPKETVSNPTSITSSIPMTPERQKS